MSQIDCRFRQCLIVFVGAAALALADGAAAASDELEIDPWLEVGFVVIRSTPDYAEAKRVAERAATRLGVPIDLRGLLYDPRRGLTLSEESCGEDGITEFPCYWVRGRYDSGAFLSIERSDAYPSFRPGYFVVVAANGDPSSPEMKSALHSARATYPDAYMKREMIYQGCMH